MKISILTPNYNHGKYITSNISGVLDQTYKNWEHIIVDDGSTDDSRAIIADQARKDPRIRPIFHERNQGVNAAFNTALNACTGTLFYGSAADDYISNPNFFQNAVTEITNHSAHGFFGRTRVFNPATGDEINIMGSALREGFIAPQDAMDMFLRSEIFVPGASSIWKISTLIECGGIDRVLGPQSDYFLNHAIPAVGGVVFNSEIMTNSRYFATSYGSSADDFSFFERIALVEKRMRCLPINYDVDQTLFQNWRDRMISSRLSIDLQNRIFDTINITLANQMKEITPWERQAFPPKLIEAIEQIVLEAKPLEFHFQQKISAAHDIFDRVAGVC